MRPGPASPLLMAAAALTIGGCGDSSVSTVGATTEAPNAAQSADPTAPTGNEPPIECAVVYSTGPGGLEEPVRAVLRHHGAVKRLKFADLAVEFKRTADNDPASYNTVFVSVKTVGSSEQKPLFYATYQLPDLMQRKLLNQLTASPGGKEEAVFAGEASVLHPVFGSWVTYTCRSLEPGADQAD